MAEVSPQSPSALRRYADRLSRVAPSLMAQARQLAQTVVLGAHGRRRPSLGENFWQYRQAGPGDSAAVIDWRRSARSDALFVRETEWETAQTVWLWCDRTASMAYKSRGAHPQKRQRAQVLCAAMALLLSRGGERISALGTKAERPSYGASHMARVVAELAKTTDEQDSGAPQAPAFLRGGHAVFVSDFFGEEEKILSAIRACAARGAEGLIIQVLDPAEESFPYSGRTLFESMGGALRYETDRADALREDYKAALAQRRARLEDAAASAGWRFNVHRTNEAPAPLLMWAAQALSVGRER